MSWNNDDGLLVRFAGDHRNDDTLNRVRGVNNLGVRKQLVLPFDLELLSDTAEYSGAVSFSSDLNNDGARDGFNSGDAGIPAGAYITDVVIYVTEAAAGGTSIAVGTYALDGTADDADGLLTSILTAALTDGAMFDRIGSTYDGAQVGAQVQADATRYIAIGCTGTFTAGKGVVIVEYIDEQPV